MFFFIFFHDLNFLSGLYGYQISRECLFAESLISKIVFLQSRKTLKTHKTNCQYGINKWEVVSLENETRPYIISGYSKE